MDNEKKSQYKKTDIGIIPEDWGVRSVHQIGNTYGGLSGKKKKDFGHGDAFYIPFMNIMSNIVIDTNFFKQVDILQDEKQQKAIKGDLFFNGSSETPEEVGMCSVLTSEIPSLYLNSFCFGLRLYNLKEIDGLWLSYLFRSNFGRKFIFSLAQGATRYNLSKNNFHKLKIPLPSFEEQKAIAAVLSDVDGLIESLERLIAKKRDMKTAAMQQLLTGKKRLPDFDASNSYKQTGIGILPEDWDLALLGEIFEITSSKRVFQNEWQKSGVPFYRARELAVLGEKGEVDNDLFIDHDLYEKHKRNYGVPQIDDVLVTGVGTLGKVYVVPDESLFYFKDGNIIWFKVRGRLNSYFLKQLYYTPLIEHQISESSAGSTVGTYTITGAKKTLIPVPKLEEQKAIAGVLSDMDCEIDALEQRLKKARSLKTGMMQELLTGKTRLIQPAMQAKMSKIKHNKHFEDAVIIAVLADRFGSEEFPLHRFRYTKFSYLLRRRIQQNTEQYLKKVAGPYNPQTRYGGAETISINKKYVNVKNKGFIAGNDIDEAKKYFDKWFEIKSLDWLERFRFTTNERLELWTTVDMAMQDLRKQNRKVTVSQIKNVIQSNKEWNKKLSKELFSDANIQKAIDKSLDLFGH